ncbi:alpha/beta hydrolase [Microbacterium sp. DT81.1]|uniref:alpha/beta hydrolase n=1 Tax=Microbacterium sp. DT81.1 TaxID=3393413 RepID=UPI003CEB4AE2
MRTRLLLGVVALVSAVLLAGCQSSPPAPGATTTGGVTVDVEKSIAYEQVDGKDLDLDACIPKDDSAGPFPAVILIHGGAFQEGSRSNMLSLCGELAKDGLAAFAIDYRLLPASFPAQAEDTATAVDWLRETAQTDRFNLSGDIALLGSSAGGIIALTAADALAKSGSPVSAVVTLSAAGDLTSEALALGDPDPSLEEVVLSYLGCDDIDDCPQAVTASPRFNVPADTPTLLVHGSEDVIPVEQAEALEQAMREAGADVTLLVVDGERHGLQLIDNGSRVQIRDFLVDRMSP